MATNSDAYRTRFLVHSNDPARLREFMDNITDIPDIDLIDAIGPEGLPHTLVVAMHPDTAQALAAKLTPTSQLTIEPDRPLNLFEDADHADYADQADQADYDPTATKGTQMPKTPDSDKTGAPDPASQRPDRGTPRASTDRRTTAAAMSESVNPSTGNGSLPASASDGTGGGTPASPSADNGGGTPASAGGATGRGIRQRKSQFLVAARNSPGMQLAGLQPLQFGIIEQALRDSPDIEVVDKVGPSGIMGALADGMSDQPSILVTRMTNQKAAILNQQGQGRLIVESDQPLSLLDASFPQPGLVFGSSLVGPALQIRVTVLDNANAPLASAEVYVFGSMLPATAVTDQNGEATVALYGETLQSIRALYVKPKADYWSFYQANPDLSADETNVVVLRALAEWSGLADFPRKQTFGWGQRAMRLDQLPDNLRGQGVRIAVIDSGAATTHSDLQNIRLGFDVINKKTSPDTWNQDTVAHGSHCAGIIAGSDNASGVRGFAPDAEVHVCKLFPGGQVSQLIDALEYCIEKQIDVVNLSLGGAEPSEALEQQLLRARRAGIACIVAAGNSGGAVQYPASSTSVLAVAAIGKLGEFPADSYHSQTVTSAVDANGFFSAKFSCYGQKIAVCAPGVAIASSVPSDNYAVWDGTSMAAPHVTGLAALVLAHHPIFQSTFRERSAQRVDQLFQMIRSSTRPINLGDPSRTGMGLPDVLIALGLQPPIGQPATQTFGAMPPGSIGSLFRPLPGEEAGSAIGRIGGALGNANSVFGNAAFQTPSPGTLWANYESMLRNAAGAGQAMAPRGAETTMGGSMDAPYGALMQNPYGYPMPMTALQAFGYPIRPGSFGPIGW